MFEVIDKGTGKVVMVYSVDFMHDAFLIYRNNKFRWVYMNEFRPVGDATCQ